ncbi:glycosyl transferase [Paramesorhizobium deserti]|uniref:Glycosyl transferase n=1 Tax=Paramesorhizobium deserti TaxID=1494590 RepID=A0A135HZZ3_9HYPH|nr:glycosyltransferase [Paramesorhizobium deserti]KXF78728.1 glycosyl transferase [Paramesorhizobium deserti]
MSSVDVLIPNYNYGRYLRACADSVLSQDIDDLRLLIIDNASTDDSAQVAREIAARDPRVELRLRRENLGPHSSFNEGIDWAQSDYFLLLFADDFLVPGALRRAAAVMDREADVAFTYGRDVAIEGDASIPDIDPQPVDVPYRLHRSRAFIERFCRLGVFQIPGPSIVIRTSVQKRAGYYRTELPHSDDYDLWLRLALHGSIAELDCIQAGIRSHGANRSSELRTRQIMHILHTAEAAECFFTHEGRDMPDGAYLRRLARRGIAERAYWSAVSHIQRGEPGAMELLKLAFRLRPQTAILPPLGYLLRRPDTMRRIKKSLSIGKMPDIRMA